MKYNLIVLDVDGSNIGSIVAAIEAAGGKSSTPGGMASTTPAPNAPVAPAASPAMSAPGIGAAPSPVPGAPVSLPNTPASVSGPAPSAPPVAPAAPPAAAAPADPMTLAAHAYAKKFNSAGLKKILAKVGVTAIGQVTDPAHKEWLLTRFQQLNFDPDDQQVA